MVWRRSNCSRRGRKSIGDRLAYGASVKAEARTPGGSPVAGRAFVIAVSGPGVSPIEEMIFYYAAELRGQGFSDSEIAEASNLRRMVWHYLSTGVVGYEEAKSALVRHWYAALQAQQDGLFALSDSAILDDASRRSHSRRSLLWFRLEMKYDPVATLRRLLVPALFLFGKKDELVPMGKSLEIITKR
jgi:pimeloyl-ACP methyl ester carboxylesterase